MDIVNFGEEVSKYNLFLLLKHVLSVQLVTNAHQWPILY